MTLPVSIRGIGVVGGFGCGLPDFIAALERGDSPRSALSLSTEMGQIDLPAMRADVTALKDLVPPKALRRLDHFSKLALLGSRLALDDAGISDPADMARLGVVVATGYGATWHTFKFLDSFIQDGDICASPIHFANSVSNTAAANISIVLGAKGPNLTVSQFDLSVPSALLTAHQWLADGRVDRVLFGAVDELSDLIGYLWWRSRGIPQPGPISPLRTTVDTALPGEGAVFLLLSNRADETEGYAHLESISIQKGALERNEPGALILGADGRTDIARHYLPLVLDRVVACHSACYGSLPPGPGFDVAAAALSLKEGRFFPSSGDGGCYFPATIPNGGSPIEGDKLACLSVTQEGMCGLISLSRCDPRDRNA